MTYQEQRDTFYQEALRLRRKYYCVMKAHPTHAESKALYTRANRLVTDIEKILYEQG